MDNVNTLLTEFNKLKTTTDARILQLQAVTNVDLVMYATNEITRLNSQLVTINAEIAKCNQIISDYNATVSTEHQTVIDDITATFTDPTSIIERLAMKTATDKTTFINMYNKATDQLEKELVITNFL